MTNYERYRDEILKMSMSQGKSLLCCCTYVRVGDANYCSNTCKNCSRDNAKWLDKEYIEQKDMCEDCNRFHRIEDVNDFGYCDKRQATMIGHTERNCFERRIEDEN